VSHAHLSVYPVYTGISSDEEYTNFDDLKNSELWMRMIARRPFFGLISDSENPMLTASMIFDRFVWVDLAPVHSYTDIFQFFHFNDLDHRYNTVESMLLTFMAELVCAGAAETDEYDFNLLKIAGSNQMWNLDDMFTVIFDLLLLREKTRPYIGLTWILVNFHQGIQSYKWLVDKLQWLATNCEVALNVLIINSPGLSLGMTPPFIDNFSKIGKLVNPAQVPESKGAHSHGQGEFPPDGGDRSQDDDKSDNHNDASKTKSNKSQSADADAKIIDIEVLRLLQLKPQLYKASPLLLQTVSALDGDKRLRQMFLAWIYSQIDTETSENLLRAISRLVPLTPSKLFKLIISSLSRYSKSDFFDDVLHLVAFSVRPIHIREIMDLDSEELLAKSLVQIEPSNHAYSPVGWLLGLLRINEHEVQLAHPLLRDFLLSPDGEWSDESRKKNMPRQNARLATHCLKFLASTRARELISQQGFSADQVILENRHTFLVYAVKYWPVHASFGGSEFKSDSKVVQEFLGNKTTLDNWAKLYRKYDGLPKPEQDGSSASAISILAEYGLVELFDGTLNRYRSLPSFHSEYSLALEAAARSADITILQKLLDMRLFDETSLERAAFSAIGSLRVEAVEVIVKELIKYPHKPRNLCTLLHRSALLGQIEAARSILTITKEDDISTFQENTLFQSACKGGNKELVELIFDKYQKLHKPGEEEQVQKGIELACTYGHQEVAVFLLEKEHRKFPPAGQQFTVVISDLDENMTGESRFQEVFSQALFAAIRGCQHRTIHSLLMAYPDYSKNVPFLRSQLNLAVSMERPSCLKELLAHIKKPIKLSKDGAEEKSLFSAAVEKQNAAVFHELLVIERGIDSSNFSSLLTDSIRLLKRDEEFALIKILLEAGKKRCEESTYTEAVTAAFGIAVEDVKESLVEYLADKGIDYTVQSANGRTPLYKAAYNGRVRVLKAMLAANADPNTPSGDSDLWLPLHAGYDYAEVVKLLLAAKADVNALTTSGYSALFLACRWQQPDSVVELMKYSPNLDIISDRLMLLSNPSYMGTTAIVSLLLDAGLHPQKFPARNLDRPPLHWAVGGNNPETLRLLLTQNIEIDEVDDDGNTPLTKITATTLPSIIKMLVNRGASVDITNGEQKTPLYIAVLEDNFEAVEYLLLKGANVNHQISRGSTALHLACWRNDVRTVQLLIENGANPNTADATSFGTPIQASCRGYNFENRTEVISLLLSNDKIEIDKQSDWWGCNLNLACLTADLPVLDMILEHRAQLDSQDKVGRRPIHFALYRTVEFIQKLCDKGADLDCKDLMDRGPLHFAVLSGRLDVVKHVLKGREHLVNQVDIDNWTPLLWAVRKCGLWETQTSERADIIEELYKHGAKRLVLGKGIGREWTPYSLARYYDLDDSILKLVTPSEEEIEKSPQKEYWHFTLKENTKAARVADDSWFCDACLMVSQQKNASLSYKLQLVTHSLIDLFSSPPLLCSFWLEHITHAMFVLDFVSASSAIDLETQSIRATRFRTSLTTSMCHRVKQNLMRNRGVTTHLLVNPRMRMMDKTMMK
jgi:ankyrin repeat protein